MSVRVFLWMYVHVSPSSTPHEPEYLQRDSEDPVCTAYENKKERLAAGTAYLSAVCVSVYADTRLFAHGIKSLLTKSSRAGAFNVREFEVKMKEPLITFCMCWSCTHWSICTRRSLCPEAVLLGCLRAQASTRRRRPRQVEDLGTCWPLLPHKLPITRVARDSLDAKPAELSS